MPSESLAVFIAKTFAPAVNSMNNAILPFNKVMEEEQKILKQQIKSGEKLSRQAIDTSNALRVMSRQSTRTVTGEEGATNGSSLNNVLEVGNILFSTGAVDFVRDELSDALKTKTAGKYGAEAGIIASSTAHGGVTGAVAGMMIGSASGSAVPLLGTAIGAAAGLIVGAVSGAVQNFENRDNAFKDVVKSQFDKVISKQQQDIQAGSELAAAQEVNSMVPWRTPTESFEGLTQQLVGLEQSQQMAMGEGYNKERKEGLKEQIGWMDGEQGGKMAEANKLIGEYQASLDNERERILRAKQDEALQQIKTESLDGAEAGRVLMEAQVEAENEYQKSDGYQLQLKTQKTMLDNMRLDLTDGWENFGFSMSQEFTKGIERGRADLRAMLEPNYSVPDGTAHYLSGETSTLTSISSYAASGYAPKAFGQSFVPYDNFPALLHQGERVLTASEARAADRGGTSPVTVTGNNFSVREEADIDKIALALAQQLMKARVSYAP